MSSAGPLSERLSETLSAFDRPSSSFTPLTTSEVADATDCSRRAAYNRLDELVDRGALATKKVGARGRIWWRTSGTESEDGVGTDGPGETLAGDERGVEFRSLVGAVDEYAIFMLDTDGAVVTWNDGARRIKGYRREEIVGDHYGSFYTEAAAENGVPERNLEQAAAQGSVELTGWRVRADGSRFWANATLTAVRDDDGTLQGYVKVTRDMTDHREYETRLRRQRDLVRKLFETSTAGVVLIDADGTVEETNERARDLLGVHPAGVPASEWPLVDEAGEPIPGDDRPVARVFETGERVGDWEARVDRPDTERWVSVTAAPLTCDDGGVEQVVVTLYDVTPLKSRQRRLERHRDDLQHELGEVFERIDDAVLALDDDWRVTYLNTRAERLLGRSADELVGRSIREGVPDAIASTFRGVEGAIDARETVTFEEYYSTLDAWFDVRAYPSETGLSVHFRDVTERKEREAELERYETIVETIDDGVYVLDDDYEFVQMNDAYAEMTGYDRTELLGSHCSLVVGEGISERAAAFSEAMVAGDGDHATIEAEIQRADGDALPAESKFTPLPSDDGTFQGTVGVVRDVTERKRRERELERYATIVETVDDGIYAVDADARFILVNDAFCELTGYGRAELLGAHATTVHGDEITPKAATLVAEVDAGERKVANVELDIHRADGTSVPAESRLGPIDLDDGRGRCGVVRDVTERVERERELERRVRQQEVVTELGHRALEGEGLDALMAEAAELVADTLDTDYCKMLDLDAEAEELLLRQGVGWDDGLVGSETVSSVEAESQAAYTLGSDAPVVVTDLATESRFSGPDLLASHGVRSGVTTVVGPVDEPWGVLGVHDRRVREFADHDVDFVQSVATILANAIDRQRNEQQLRRQREQLAAVNNLNEIVNGIVEAVIDRSTREEIERAVCERLAAADSYLFAWIGDVDSHSQTVRVRTEAGVDGYLDDVTVSIDPDNPRSQGATGRALRTGETQVTQDVRGNPDYEQWREHVRAHGFRSSAAIPITHEGTLYGVLNVYASRPNGFEGDERAVVSQLGEVMGHAIASIERKRALMSDEVLSIEYRIRDCFDVFDAPATAETIRLDQVVPAGNDEYLLYGSTSAHAFETVLALADTVPTWTTVTRLTEGSGTVRFEVQLSEPPVVSEVASHGGYVDQAVIEDGDYRIEFHLPPGVEPRRISEVVRESYPSAEFVAKRHVTRTPDSVDSLKRVLAEELTDRQRSALEAAYFGGFFEWPREQNGEDVADAIGISPPTLHQHLRIAQRKLLSATFDDARDARD
ncbi:PAS domain S-box protein [Salinigranum marinum]|uniref:PAS domain S-box protein n=1 Tax=Salinigranum marinum TaxID=1515595 RepID=UPI002989A2A0|nr:PAS domain S-box protein [Salinigranum marinum]